MLQPFNQYLVYKMTEGQEFADLWLSTFLDYWYLEDKETINLYVGLNQFRLWKITCQISNK